MTREPPNASASMPRPAYASRSNRKLATAADLQRHDAELPLVVGLDGELVLGDRVRGAEIERAHRRAGAEAGQERESGLDVVLHERGDVGDHRPVVGAGHEPGTQAGD